MHLDNDIWPRLRLLDAEIHGSRVGLLNAVEQTELVHRELTAHAIARQWGATAAKAVRILENIESQASIGGEVRLGRQIRLAGPEKFFKRDILGPARNPEYKWK